MFGFSTNINKQSGKAGKTPLIRSIEKNDQNKFQKLINNPEIKIDLGDKFYRTPLMYAFFNGRMDFVQLLLQKKVNINIFDSSGRTLLYYYVESGNTEVVKYLLSIGACIEWHPKLEKHCLNVMPVKMLNDAFAIYSPDGMLNALRNNSVNNDVKRNYINYLGITQNWSQLKKYYAQLDDKLRYIRIQIFETLPENVWVQSISNNTLLDYLLNNQYEKCIDLIKKGAEIDQKLSNGAHILSLITDETLLETLFSQRAPELINILANPSNSLNDTHLWGDYIKYLQKKEDFLNLKQFFYAIKPIQDQINIRSFLNEIFLMIPEKDQNIEFGQAIFQFLDKSKAKEMVRKGFDINFEVAGGNHILLEIDKDLRKFIFESTQPERMVPIIHEIMKKIDMIGRAAVESIFNEYISFLKTIKSWTNMKALYWSLNKGISRDFKTKIYELLPLEEQTEYLKNDIISLFPNITYDFIYIPKGLVQLNNEQVIETVKHYVKKYETDKDIMKLLAESMQYQGVTITCSIESMCGICDGSGYVGNFDSALERDTYSYECVCGGKKELVKFIVERDNQIIWNLS